MTALPTRKFARFCEETIPNHTTGTGDYSPTARIAPFLRFGGTPGPVQLSDGDYFDYTCWDGNDVEMAVGRYRTGPIRVERPISEPTWIFFSTNGGALVNWPSGATLNIAGTDPSKGQESLFGAAQTTGFVRRSGELVYTPVTPASVSELIDINPATLQLADKFHSLFRDSGVPSLFRTMSGQLIQSWASMRLDAADFEILGSGGATDRIARFSRLGSDQYRIQEHRTAGGSGYSNVLTVADIPILCDWDFKTSTATAQDTTTLELQTTMSFNTPNVANESDTYAIVLFGVVQGYTPVTINSSDDSSGVVAKIQEGGVDAAEGTSTLRLNASPLILFADSGASIPVIHLRPATPGVAYTYRLSAGFTGTQAASASLNASGLLRHCLIGACLRLT